MKIKIIIKDLILEIKIIINLAKDLITKINLVITAKTKTKKTQIKEAANYRIKPWIYGFIFWLLDVSLHNLSLIFHLALRYIFA